MEHKDAVELIKFNVLNSTKQRWADLGCGTGTFTLALASLLPDDSLIYAVDINKNSLDTIPDKFNKTKIEKVKKDFLNIVLPTDLDGILMANSLHYVKDKKMFIRNIEQNIKKYFLIIEYDTDKSNPWVPYPIDFKSLKKLFDEFEFSAIKLKERTSVFRRANIYSALIKKN